MITAQIEALAELTERQVEAARSLKGEIVQALDRERSDRLFELSVALQEEPVIEPMGRESFRNAIGRLRSAEDRLQRVARTVLGALAALRRPGEVPTYARTGTMRG